MLIGLIVLLAPCPCRNLKSAPRSTGKLRTDRWQQVQQPLIPDRLDQGVVEHETHGCELDEGVERLSGVLARARSENKVHIFKTPVAP